MSIINSDQYNADWQLRVLRGLQNMSDQLASTINVIGNVNATIVNPLGSLTAEESVSIAIAKDQFAAKVSPVILLSTGDLSTTISDEITSISFASIGTADALISFDSGSNYVALATGTTVNMDAGGIMNVYGSDTFGYDTDTNAGASLLITYNKA